MTEQKKKQEEIELGKLQIHGTVSRMGTSYIVYIPTKYNDLIKRYYKKNLVITIEPLREEPIS